MKKLSERCWIIVLICTVLAMIPPAANQAGQEAHYWIITAGVIFGILGFLFEWLERKVK